LPGKNARPFLGEPLLGRAIRVALQTCDDVVVTTDNHDLAALAYPYGVQVRMRPAELATDEAPMLPVVQDAIEGREGDVIVLLQPTQPLRTSAQVLEAIALLEPQWDSVVSVKAVPPAFSPDRMLKVVGTGPALWPLDSQEDGIREVRRQAARPGYVRDGTVYVVRRRVVEDSIFGSLYGDLCRAMILPGNTLSIDTLEDFERLEALAARMVLEALTR
jgi:N-acylneuraminate cytidylyltransferase